MTEQETDPGTTDLIKYVLGEAPPAVAERIEAQLQRDEDLMARVDVLTWPLGIAATPASSRTRSYALRVLLSKPAVASACLLLVALIIVGGYRLLAPRPLFDDNFSGTSINPSKWRKARDVAVAEDGHLRLVNRGSVVSVPEFDGPISVSLRWMWKDLTEGKENYADILSLGLRTTGRHADSRPFELQDGVRVSFRGDGKTGSVVIYWSALGPTGVQTHALDLPIPANVWHELRITDDGEIVSVYLRGPQIGDNYWKKPVLTARPEGIWQGHHIAVYNREHVGDVPHESHIDQVLVERFQYRDN